MTLPQLTGDPMQIQQQHNSDLTLLSEMIEEITVAMLTNVNEHGALTSRPMTPLEMDSEGALWFFIDRTSVPNVERLSGGCGAEGYRDRVVIDGCSRQIQGNRRNAAVAQRDQQLTRRVPSAQMQGHRSGRGVGWRCQVVPRVQGWPVNASGIWPAAGGRGSIRPGQ